MLEMLNSLSDFCTSDELARLRQQLELRQLSVRAIGPIERGLSNHSFCLTLESQTSAVQTCYLLRINAPVTDKICDRVNEVACWRAAETAGLAPKLYWVDSEYRFYLAQWIDETANQHQPSLAPWRQFGASIAADNLALTQLPSAKLAELLAHKPHQAAFMNKTEQQLLRYLLPLLTGLRALPAPKLVLSLAQQWHIYLERLQAMAANGNYCSSGLYRKTSGVATDGWLTRLSALTNFDINARINALDAVLLSNQYCHRDLSANNLLLAGDKLLCIDFEYCCSSHPLFELAGVLATHALSPAAQQQLVRDYLFDHPHLTANAIDALPAALDIFWLYSCAWALQMADGACQDSREYFSWFDGYWQLIQH